MFDSTKRSCFERGFAPSEGVVEMVILGKVSSNPCCNNAMINSPPSGLVCHSSSRPPPLSDTLWFQGPHFWCCESLFLIGKIHHSMDQRLPSRFKHRLKRSNIKTTTSKQPGPLGAIINWLRPPPFLSHQYIDGHVTSSRSATLAAPNSVVSLAASNGNGSSARSATPPRLETCDFPWGFSLKIPKRKVGFNLGMRPKKHAKSYYSM